MTNKKKAEPAVKERHFGVILENIDSKVDLLVEGHKTLDKKIDRVDENLEDFRQETNYKFKVVQETLNSHSKILDSHSKTLNSHTQILNSHTQTLNSHTQMIAKNSEDLEIIKSDIEFIKNALKKKVDAEEFESLEKRVLLLEKKVSRARV